MFCIWTWVVCGVCSPDVRVFVHSNKAVPTRSSQLSSIIYNSLSFPPATIPHSPSLQPSLSRPRPPSPVMLLSSPTGEERMGFYVTHSPVIYHISVWCGFAHCQGFEGILLPWRQFRLAVYVTVMWLSLTPAGGTGALQPHNAFDWKPVWHLRDFSVWNFCEMVKWFLLCTHIYHHHWRLHDMFISYFLTLFINFISHSKRFIHPNLNHQKAVWESHGCKQNLGKFGNAGPLVWRKSLAVGFMKCGISLEKMMNKWW